MSQDGSSLGLKGHDGAKKPDADFDGQVTDDVGGVQGSPPAEDTDEDPVAVATPGSPPDQPAPDAGEIEWAGQLIKKPPTPERYALLHRAVVAGWMRRVPAR